MLLRRPLTPFRAMRIIVLMTALVTVTGGVLIRLVDSREFPDLGESLWWSLQTVTTVGYGDVVPRQVGGRIIGAVVMLQGIGFITIVAASVTAALIEQARTRRARTPDPELPARLERIDARLSAIERSLGERRDRPG